MTQPPKKLLDQVRDVIRVKHYSPRTEKAYVGWITRFILFHDKRHPLEMGTPEIEKFLTHLATDQQVAAATQNQALCAILFLYRHVLHVELDDAIDSVRAKKPKRLPTVLTKDEAFRVIGCLTGTYQLAAKLLYGSGLRVGECLRLRVKDVDFAQHQITIHDGKSMKDRVTMLPVSVVPPLQEHLRRVKWLHDDDLGKGRGYVTLPFALNRKYPHANHEWLWQYVFPDSELTADPHTGLLVRGPMAVRGLQAAIKRAAQQAGIAKRVSPHTFPHPPAGRWLRHPHRPGAPRPQGRQNDDDLYPRPQPGWLGCPQPLGLIQRRQHKAGCQRDPTHIGLFPPL